jgi:hypothetical protein
MGYDIKVKKSTRCEESENGRMKANECQEFCRINKQNQDYIIKKEVVEAIKKEPEDGEMMIRKER